MLEAETRERNAGLAPVAAEAPSGRRLPAPWSRPAAATGLADAAVTRRLFVLLPFAMIAGLIAYAVLPGEPQPQALLAIGIALAVLIAMLWRSVTLSLASLLVAAWIGFCLLPVHGLWFGTTMLTRPAYGLYEARVDEIVSATSEARRIVVSGLTPLADDRPRPPPAADRNWGRRLWATIWATALTSFIAGTATLLFSAYHFQQTAPLGVLGNVLVLPVVSLIIMPFAVLSVLAMPFGVEAPFVAVMGWGHRPDGRWRRAGCGLERGIDR
ncbi:ComEC/Rec2 family competence protein [Devosia ginsengisoli]|uniref:ComEC/Rec2 family competence protein n=1 Tax=Devosia ginsengisoli TaxID=400770 RepID=UPI0026EE144E|nr:ComEC/Rec2 family competence protein [Devosia ginsengisoli]MCR6672468.1 ComEC/Rec2 family competence protein [Devosia ginsengisoli]